MGGTYDPSERNDDQDDDLKAGEEVRFKYTLNKLVIRAKLIYYETKQDQRRPHRSADLL